MIDLGRAYACYETQEELSLKRKAQLLAGRPPIYDRAGLKLSAVEKEKFEAQGRRPHWRFLLNDAEVQWHDLVRGFVSYNMSSLSDPVLMREDGRVIYTLASVVDDIDHCVTHILRGEDHVTNSAAQIQLFEALGASANNGAYGIALGQMGRVCRSVWVAYLLQICVHKALSLLLLPASYHVLVPLIQWKQRQKWQALLMGFDIGRFGRATAKFDLVGAGQN